MAYCILFYLPAHSTQRYISSKQHVNNIPFHTLYGFAFFFKYMYIYINICHNTNLAAPARGSTLHSLSCLNPEGPAAAHAYFFPLIRRNLRIYLAYLLVSGPGYRSRCSVWQAGRFGVRSAVEDEIFTTRPDRL